MSDDDIVATPPAGPDDWRKVWEQDRRYAPRPSRHEWFLRVARRVNRRALEPDTERQKNFNVVLLDLVADVRRLVESVRGELKNDIASVQRDVRAADEALALDVKKVHELIPVAAKRNDALIAALDQKIETLAVRLRDAVNQRAASGGEGRAASGERRAGEAAPAAAGEQGTWETRRNDLLYRRLEDGLRGSEAEVRAALAPYIEYAREYQPLFDVGCGRGELLLAAREAGIQASGCDTNERSVADLRQRGVDVALSGVPECFSAFGDGSLGSVAAMHVVEHLPVEVLFSLFVESARVLRAGGLLMIETPNAESLLVGASEFWRDPTHLAPRHPAALTMLAREHGFDIAEIRAVHEFPEGTRLAVNASDPPELQRVVSAINERLFAPQDLRLVLRKR